MILQCLGVTAPYYNLVLVAIVLALFAYLFSLPAKKANIRPWKYLFAGIIIFVIEEAMTVLSAAQIISFPHIIFSFFEMAIIILFLYMCLVQRESP